MEMMKRVYAFFGVGTKRKKMVDGVCIVLYVLLTVFLLRGIILKNYVFGTDDWQHSIMYYSLYIVSIIIVQVWLYLCLKHGAYYSEIDNYFSANEYKQVWKDVQESMMPLCFKKRGMLEKIIKIVYILVWIGIIFLVVFTMDRLDYFQFLEIELIESKGGTVTRVFSLLGLCLFVGGTILNFNSYYVSITFSYFLRNVSKISDKLAYNHEKPSYTYGFHKLVHIASRTSIGFFSIAMLYILELLVCMTLGGPVDSDQSVFLWLLVACAIFPCIISMLLVFTLSKAFLNRLLRDWKFNEMIELQNKGVTSPVVLEQIYKDKFPVLRADITIAFITLIVNVGSLAFAAIQTFYSTH
ncbi:hypothetical protein [Butyrivibrio sp. MC2013]|uniref:hypothetical protein n=1 Tax=Butyrivibrio sp. MC2013 TaxID=1280686 RepID=UPI0003FD7626|nr:hypothetical protein [Butyrivibrio sp. MC2013]